MTYSTPKCYYCDQENFNAEEVCSETGKSELLHSDIKWCEYCEEKYVDRYEGDSDSCAECYREGEQIRRDQEWDYRHA